MKKSIVALVFFSVLAQAYSCKFTQKNNIEVLFRGYKTEFKVAMGSHFNDIKYSPAKNEAPTLKQLLVGSSVIINIVDIGSKEDLIIPNLKEYFFKKIIKKDIRAKIIAVEADKEIYKKSGYITIELDFNGVKKELKTSYFIKKGEFHARWHIYMRDFNASDALNSLDNACSGEHLGVTWDDVHASLIIKIDEICY
ncbi:hypothetical protein HUE87_11295 [Candidatus Sulfurimonas marisnigri]|uniref:Lipid/polyisoprenoid-binding YceI-like domain-containing protein n=1 Tax=Candidatus Sulfurimonas marisnigri TaxID=2740405 RepID=A0A7S7RQ96_9BACT|nr:hypothetical protein [Candidatus Sulfurimonas marisnigri]QOY54446.1 hypothetical protein HUE87_11295 [Candidatus Sulfurimonas marisnigri]